MTKSELDKLKEDIAEAERGQAEQYPNTPFLISYRLQLALVEELREIKEALVSRGEVQYLLSPVQSPF